MIPSCDKLFVLSPASRVIKEGFTWVTGFIIEFETKEFSRSVSNEALSIPDDSVEIEILNTYYVLEQGHNVSYIRVTVPILY